MNAVRSYVDMAWGLISHGAHDGGMHWIDVFFGAWILLMPLVIIGTLVSLVVQAISDRRAERERAKARAMRRHPSARTMTEREARFHSSNQWGV